MPIGPYKDWDTCVKDQMSKGKSKKSADKICGFLEKKARGKEKMNNVEKKDWRELSFVVPITESVRNEQQEFLIRGIAINATVTRNKIRYTEDELRSSADSLQSRPILKNHWGDVDSIVGKVTRSNYNEFSGLINFEGQIMDKDMQEMINDGRITAVSVGAIVKDLIYESKEDEKNNILTAKGIDFVELSLVAVPADPNAGFTKALYESFELKQQLETIGKDDDDEDDFDDDLDEKNKAKVVNSEKVEKLEDINLIDNQEGGQVDNKNNIMEESVKMTDEIENKILSRLDEMEKKISEATKAKEEVKPEVKTQEKTESKDLEEMKKLKEEIEALKAEKEKAVIEEFKKQIDSLKEENKVLKETKPVVVKDEKVETRGKVNTESVGKIDEQFADNYVFENSQYHMGEALWQDPLSYTQETLKVKKVGKPTWAGGK